MIEDFELDISFIRKDFIPNVINKLLYNPYIKTSRSVDFDNGIIFYRFTINDMYIVFKYFYNFDKLEMDYEVYKDGNKLKNNDELYLIYAEVINFFNLNK